MDAAERAMIYAPAGPEAGTFHQQCAIHCRRRGYRITHVVHSPDDVARVWRTGQVEHIVVARTEHLRQIAWGVEIAGEDQTGRRPRQRPRTRRVIQ